MNKKKKMKKITGLTALSIMGAGSKTFAEKQEGYNTLESLESKETVNNTIVQDQVVYGPPPSNMKKNLGLFSIITSILLFIIGIVVILNKKISKNAKIIVSTIIVLAIVILILLKLFL